MSGRISCIAREHHVTYHVAHVLDELSHVGGVLHRRETSVPAQVDARGPRLQQPNTTRLFIVKDTSEQCQIKVVTRRNGHHLEGVRPVFFKVPLPPKHKSHPCIRRTPTFALIF